MSMEETDLIFQEIREMPSKEVISKVENMEGQILSSIFFVGKKNRGNCPVNNLKELNKDIPYLHFKMGYLFLLNGVLLQGDLICKIDLEGANFADPLYKNSQKHMRLQWKGFLYEFLCFDLDYFQLREFSSN